MVHDAGNLHGTHFAGALRQLFQFRQVQETHPAAHPLLFQALGQEGGEEVVIAQEVHDEHFAGKLGRREDVDILQRQGGFLEVAQRSEPHARVVVQPHTGLPKEFQNALIRFFQAFEAAGEEVQGVLPGTHDGGTLPCLLQGDARQHAGQASADYNGIKFHRPSTCL